MVRGFLLPFEFVVHREFGDPRYFAFLRGTVLLYPFRVKELHSSVGFQLSSFPHRLTFVRTEHFPQFSAFMVAKSVDFS